MGIVDSIKKGLRLSSGTVEEGMDFGKGRFVNVLKYKLMASLAVVAIVVGAGILALGAYLGIGFAVVSIAPSSAGIGAIGGLVVAGGIVLVGVLGGYSYSLAADFGAIEYIYSGRKVGYFEPANVRAALGWSALLVGLVAALFILLNVGGLAAGTILSALGSGFAVIASLVIIGLLWVASLGALAAFIVASYYAHQELALKKSGPIVALKASWRLLKGNFWETTVFGLMVWFLSEIVAGIPSFVISMGMQLCFGLFALGPVFIAIGAAVMLLLVVAMFAIGLAVGTGALILKVSFYKKIANPDSGAKKKKAS